MPMKPPSCTATRWPVPPWRPLTEKLIENPHGLLVVRDELPGWLAGLDRENAAKLRAFLMTGWNGKDGWTFDRIGRGHRRVPAVCLGVIGGAQPGPLGEYLRAAMRGGASDDGMHASFEADLRTGGSVPCPGIPLGQVPQAGVGLGHGLSAGGRAPRPGGLRLHPAHWSVYLQTHARRCYGVAQSGEVDTALRILERVRIGICCGRSSGAGTYGGRGGPGVFGVLQVGSSHAALSDAA